MCCLLMVYLFIYRPMCDHQQTVILLRSLEIYAAPASLVHTLDKDKENRERGRERLQGRNLVHQRLVEILIVLNKLFTYRYIYHNCLLQYVVLRHPATNTSSEHPFCTPKDI